MPLIKDFCWGFNFKCTILKLIKIMFGKRLCEEKGMHLLFICHLPFWTDVAGKEFKFAEIYKFFLQLNSLPQQHTQSNILQNFFWWLMTSDEWLSLKETHPLMADKYHYTLNRGSILSKTAKYRHLMATTWQRTSIQFIWWVWWFFEKDGPQQHFFVCFDRRWTGNCPLFSSCILKYQCLLEWLEFWHPDHIQGSQKHTRNIMILLNQ